METDDPDAHLIDMSKGGDLYSGDPLTRYESAQVRRMIAQYYRWVWIKKRLWVGLLFAVGLPSSVAAVIQLMALIARTIRGN